jgi:rhomboid protease GluP
VSDDATEVIRLSPDRARVDDWALALASAGIDARIEVGTAAYGIRVRATQRRRAERLLAAFDAENSPPPATTHEVPIVDHTAIGAIAAAVLLCAFFVVTGPRDQGAVWFERGAAIAWRIRAGELWRVVTALTLHADFPHILSNAAVLVVFGTSLCGILGSGTALWLLLASGALGNWLTAAIHGAAHDSVGASTAVFGGIGALAAIQLIHRRRGGAVSAARAWAPVAAGLALLGFLGTGPNSDILAHLFGFAAGALLGVGALPLARWRDHRTLQTLIAIAAAGLVAGCWAIARAH